MSEPQQKWMVSNPLRDVLVCAFIGATPGGFISATYDDPRFVVGGIVGTAIGLGMWLVTALKQKQAQENRSPE
jgi:hypothetical protein